MANELNIFIQKFYTKAREKTEGVMALGPDGNPILDDWVSYSPRGQDRLVVNERVEHILRVDDRMNRDHPAWIAANARREYIRPAYEAWKKGEEIPAEGTPLGVATFIGPDNAEILKRAGIRTLEELVNTPEHNRQKLNVPRIREIVVQAQRFLDMKDTNAHMAALSKQDEEIKALKAQVEALMNMKAETVEIVEKRGPGRPPKPKEAAE